MRRSEGQARRTTAGRNGSAVPVSGSALALPSSSKGDVTDARLPLASLVSSESPRCETARAGQRSRLATSTHPGGCVDRTYQPDNTGFQDVLMRRLALPPDGVKQPRTGEMPGPDHGCADEPSNRCASLVREATVHRASPAGPAYAPSLQTCLGRRRARHCRTAGSSFGRRPGSRRPSRPWWW